eukprot:175388-Pyramimonas_sp.AAC.1
MRSPRNTETLWKSPKTVSKRPQRAPLHVTPVVPLTRVGRSPDISGRKRFQRQGAVVTRFQASSINATAFARPGPTN